MIDKKLKIEQLTPTPLTKTGVNSGALEGYSVYAMLVTPVVLLLIETSIM